MALQFKAGKKKHSQFLLGTSKFIFLSNFLELHMLTSLNLEKHVIILDRQSLSK